MKPNISLIVVVSLLLLGWVNLEIQNLAANVVKPNRNLIVVGFRYLNPTYAYYLINKYLKMTELLDKIKNQNNYDDLIVSIEASYRTLNILIAVCDDSEYREKIIQKYETELSPNIPCYRVELAKGELSLRAAIASVVETDEYLQAGKQAVITVTGVDGLRFLTFDGEKSEQEKFFGYLQWTREALREFPFSIVLWVTFQMERNLSKKAPDFWAWRKGVFRFISFQKKALPREDVDFLRPVLGERLDDVDEDEPHFLPVGDLQELIEKIEAELYRSVERYSEAESLYLQAIEIDKIALPENHPSFANNLHNLAELYHSQGRYSQAEPLYLQAIEIVKIALPENHPSLATSLKNLAELYHSQGRYSEAELLYQQALDIRATTFGEEHPDTQTVRENLERCRQQQKS